MWISDVILGEHITLERDTQGIIHSFMNAPDSNCHILFRDTRLLKSSFTHVLA